MNVPESPEWWRGASYWIKKHHLSKGSDGGDNVTKILVKAAQLKPGMKVADLASGVGDPAITLAEGIGPNGRVMAIDHIFKQVAGAKKNASEKGLTNLSFQRADAQALPFFDQTFDVVTCRFGAMFFPDIDQAGREILRVLKPGGKVLLLVWGPREQEEGNMCMMQIIRKYTSKHDDPQFWNRNKVSDPGPLLAILRGVGFEHVEAESHTVPEVWLGTLEEYLEISCDGFWDDKTFENKEQVRDEVLANMRKHCGGEEVKFNVNIILVSARKITKKIEDQSSHAPKMYLSASHPRAASV